MVKPLFPPKIHISFLGNPPIKSHEVPMKNHTKNTPEKWWKKMPDMFILWGEWCLLVYTPYQFQLVGGEKPYPSEKWWTNRQLGWLLFPIWWESHKIPWFQTTNQYQLQLYPPHIIGSPNDVRQFNYRKTGASPWNSLDPRNPIF